MQRFKDLVWLVIAILRLINELRQLWDQGKDR